MHDIGADTAIQRVVPGRAAKNVGAVRSPQNVVADIADQRVVQLVAGTPGVPCMEELQPLDIGVEHMCEAGANRVRSISGKFHHLVGGVVEIENVIACTTGVHGIVGALDGELSRLDRRRACRVAHGDRKIVRDLILVGESVGPFPGVV